MTNLRDLRISNGMAAAVAILALLLSYQQAYRPTSGAYQRDRLRRSRLSDQVGQLEALVTASGGQAAWTAQQQARQSRFTDRLARRSDLPQLLNALVERVQGDGVTLANVTQGNLEPVVDGGQPVQVAGKGCYRLPLIISAAGRFHAIRRAIERLSNDTFPSLVAVEHVELRLKSSADVVLDAVIQLSLYVLNDPSRTPPAS